MKYLREDIKHMPEAFVLGMSITGLNVVRSLGRKGVPVIGLDHDYSKIGLFSMYCIKKLIGPHPRKHENSFLNFLVDQGKKLNSKAVLIPTNDDFLICLSRNRNVLNKYFIHNLPSKEIIEQLNNKEAFYHLAKKYKFPVPKTYVPNHIYPIEKIMEEIVYPCIIKAKYGYYYQDLGLKAIKISSKHQLLGEYHKLSKITNSLIIQEIVPGNDDQQYSLYSYFNVNSVPVASLTSRKLRQLPIEFGVGTLLESCVEPKIEELGLSFLKKIRYQGLSEIEFKKDAKENQFKMIEVNTRPWVQINLATRCGIDFAFLSYIDLVRSSVDTIHFRKKRVKWLCFEEDFYASFGSSGYISKGLMTLPEWFVSLIGNTEYAYFAWDDFLPFLHRLREFVKSLAIRMWKVFQLKCNVLKKIRNDFRQ